MKAFIQIVMAIIVLPIMAAAVVLEIMFKAIKIFKIEDRELSDEESDALVEGIGEKWVKRCTWLFNW